MVALQGIAGFLIFILGRQYYRLFVLVAGLIGGVYLARTLYPGREDAFLLTFALGSGALAALLSIPLKRWVVAVAAVGAGAFILYNLPSVLNGSNDWISWPYLVTAGAVSVLLLLVWFDLAVILLSVLAGLILLYQVLPFPALHTPLMFFLLVALGIITQWVLLQYGRPSPD